MTKEHTVLKWVIGIIAFVVYVAVGRGVILSDGAGYDAMEHEWEMSTGQSWAMVLWTITVIVCSIKIYKMLAKE